MDTTTHPVEILIRVRGVDFIIHELKITDTGIDALEDGLDRLLLELFGEVAE